MPSLATSNGTANGTTKFQLPALDFKFGSLTEGTDIPPPLPSPIQEEPPELPKTPKLTLEDVAKPATAIGGTQTSPEALKNGLKRSAEATLPGSPTSSKGPASIRRLFSRNRLNEAYHANGGTDVGEALSPRPQSQSNASIATNGQPKRASGWFRRLRGSEGLENKRASRVFLPTDNSKPPATPTKSTGPPPPKIPEIKALGSKVELGSDLSSLGTDLFKDIK